MGLILNILIIIGALIISAIPLHLTVTLLGGKSSILKVILVNFIVALVIALIELRFGFFAGLVSFIALLFIYKYMFKIGLLRAFLVWLLQGIIAIILIFLLVFLFGLIGIALVF